MAGQPGGRAARRATETDRRSPPPAAPRRVGSSLAEVASIIGAEGAIALAEVNAWWCEAVGPQVAAHCWPVRLEAGVLTVAVDNPAWAAQLRILSGTLLGRLEPLRPSVTKLDVRVGSRYEGAW